MATTTAMAPISLAEATPSVRGLNYHCYCHIVIPSGKLSIAIYLDTNHPASGPGHAAFQGGKNFIGGWLLLERKDGL